MILHTTGMYISALPHPSLQSRKPTLLIHTFSQVTQLILHRILCILLQHVCFCDTHTLIPWVLHSFSMALWEVLWSTLHHTTWTLLLKYSYVLEFAFLFHENCTVLFSGILWMLVCKKIETDIDISRIVWLKVVLCWVFVGHNSI